MVRMVMVSPLSSLSGRRGMMLSLTYYFFGRWKTPIVKPASRSPKSSRKDNPCQGPPSDTRRVGRMNASLSAIGTCPTRDLPIQELGLWLLWRRQPTRSTVSSGCHLGGRFAGTQYLTQERYRQQQAAFL